MEAVVIVVKFLKKSMNNSYEDLLDCVDFYDYLEVQPPEVYSHFIESSGGEITEEHIKRNN